MRSLAAGGMAELHLAVADGAGLGGKLVVLKRLHPWLAERADIRAMLVDEARLGARFAHRNLTQVFDLAEVDGNPYYAMCYVPGADLRTVLRQLHRRDEAMPVALAVHIAMEVAAGLHHAHELRDPQGRPLGVVHRDVSIANVRLSLHGGVTLLDFGVAKSRMQSTETRSGTTKGNAAYMAPEQCAGHHVDRRADVFALGILLYEMVTGTRLFRGSSPVECMRRVCGAPIVPADAIRPDVPRSLAAVIERALQRDPAHRFASAAEMAEALERVTDLRAAAAGGAALARLMESLFEPPPHPFEPVQPRPLPAPRTTTPEPAVAPLVRVTEEVTTPHPALPLAS